VDLPGNHVKWRDTKRLPHCSVQTIIVTVRISVLPHEVHRLYPSWRNAAGSLNHELIDISAIHGRKRPLGKVILIREIFAATHENQTKATFFEIRT